MARCAGSGAGIGMSLAANFIGGAAGSVLEQKIGSGSVSLKESIVSGAATAGIRYLARDWDEGGSDLAGAAFYGAGKALGFLKDSIKDVRGNKGGSPTVNKPSVRTRINNLPETKAPNAIKASDVTNAWDDYLGSNTTNIHPITGKPDPNRIFSSDATRSIRLGNHEMKSFGTTKAHFHYEKWDYNAVDDIMTISNIMQRFRE